MNENIKYMSVLVSIDTIIDIMFTKTQYRIMELLSGSQRYSIRSLARKLELSYALVYNNLSKLIKKGLVKKTMVPPASMLELSAPKEVLADIENRKRHKFLEKHQWVRLFADDFQKQFNMPFYSMVVFGSYAKEKKGSDLDIIIIAQDTDAAEKAVHEIITRKKIDAHVFTSEEFKEMLSQREFNIGNEAMDDHVILHGVDSFLGLK